MKTLILTILLLTACTPITHLNDPHYPSDGEPECRVMAACYAAWHNEEQLSICGCMDNYKELDSECTRYFQDLTVCLYQRGCSMLDCTLQFSVSTIKKCGGEYYE
jgi:hypothetical protein